MKTLILIMLLFCGQVIAQTTVILQTNNLYTIELFTAKQVNDTLQMVPMKLPTLVDVTDSTSKLIIPNNHFVYFKLRDFNMKLELVGVQTGKTAIVTLPIDFEDNLSPELIYNKDTEQYEVFNYILSKL